MLKIILSSAILLFSFVSVYAETYEEIYRCETESYGKPIGYAGDRARQAELLKSWMGPAIFYIAVENNTGYMHRYKGAERLVSVNLRYTEQRQIVKFADYPESSKGTSKIREFRFSLLNADLSFKLEMEMRNARYRKAGGDSFGHCVMEKNRTIS